MAGFPEGLHSSLLIICWEGNRSRFCGQGVLRMKVFAAIDVGSYELSMKIFEFSGKSTMREIDHIRRRIDLGTETYSTGKLSSQKTAELCKCLKEYKEIMEAYKVDAYKAYGTSAIREMENKDIVLEQIAQKTGVRIEPLSNSEQRFINYKSVAARGEEFDKMLEKGTVIVDIGGSSVQFSLFDKGTLLTTQNLRLGVLRLRERLGHINARPAQLEEFLGELDDAHLAVLNKLYFKDRKIENIILVDDYLSLWVQEQREDAKEGRKGYVSAARYADFMEEIRNKSNREIGAQLGIAEENINLLFVSAVLLNRLFAATEAELLWAPGATLCDGIAYEYAQQQKIVISKHDFEKDILDCALHISKRYMGSRKRAETLENFAVTVFDATKRLHGMGRRERLYLRLAAILHDCGKYISMSNIGECSYAIILATEMIGLSHTEREIVANVVRFNYMEFMYYEEVNGRTSLDRAAYLKVAKLTAILRIASGLDRSHKQKTKSVKAVLTDKELVLQVDSKADMTLEKGLFVERTGFFEEIFNIRPVIRQKKEL